MTTSTIDWREVTSSNVARVGYDKEAGRLYVQFKGNRVYAYSGVSEKTFHSVVSAKSVGGYFNEHIKDHYEVHKLEDD